ncbi:NAD(P)/FAD-dependent oxidoreductase [Ammoniphilus resinae]|uniref:Thioredoxin reductase (NADPH) n=1 Tax=Ammoniphilus resinae TaxID=861532 RepID=A0ABS4GVR2_9BACL|nr:FAD-dependent oxidoreductase [Ammoniphilus resinae]MBP1934363.1 thioredoxin reductase (NADPH) [Ammoniphilus resinae]
MGTQVGRKSVKKYADVVIVGGGPAGISAAIWCKRLGLNHFLLEARDTLGGQLLEIQNQIIDYPGLLSPNGKELQSSLLHHMEDLQCSYRLNTSIKAIDPEKRIVTVVEPEQQEFQLGYRFLIFSTGSSFRRLHISGEDEMIKRGERYSASKDRFKFKNKQVAVIGGGDRAFEGALLLANSGAHVFLIHRTDQFRARSEYIGPVLGHPQIQVLTHTVAHRIVGDRSVSGIELVTTGTKKTTFLPVDAVFIRIGMSPNSELLQGIVDLDKDKYIIIDKTHQTSYSDIFAVGDVCTHPVYSSISLAVGQGGIAAKTISSRMG